MASDGGLMQGLSTSEQQSLMRWIDQHQALETQGMLSSVTATCFDKCVSQFRERALTPRESTCLKNCTVKNLLHLQRVGLRISEIQQGTGQQ